MDKLTVRDFEPHGKWVFLRVDFNVPLEDGRVTDDSRIRAAIPTIHYLLTHGARVVLASHLGRPDGKVQDGLRLRPVGERLSLLLRRNVPVTGDALGLGTEDAVKRLRPGEALLLENLRFHSEEENNDPKFAATLASYAEIYVNDAFGTAHRAHASTVGVPKLLPAYAGLLMEREITALSKLLEDPEHPFVAIVGGAKVSGKLKVLENLIRKVDMLILGGGMANTFLLAQGRSVGKSLAEHDMVDQAKRILADAQARGVKVILPVDVIVAKEVTRGTEYKTLNAEKIPASWHIVDVGRQTLTLIEEALADAKTVMWNGPIGVFEIPVFGAGTRHVARILADKADAGATVVVGGGDSVAAVQQQGLAGRMTHVSTGGGASLEFLEGRELPGIAVLLDRADAPETAEPTAVAVGPGRPEELDAEPAERPRPFLASTIEAEAQEAREAAERARERAPEPPARSSAVERTPVVVGGGSSTAPRPKGSVDTTTALRTASDRARTAVKTTATNGSESPQSRTSTTSRTGSVAGAARTAAARPGAVRSTRRPAAGKPLATAARTTQRGVAAKSDDRRGKSGAARSGVSRAGAAPKSSSRRPVRKPATQQRSATQRSNSRTSAPKKSVTARGSSATNRRTARPASAAKRPPKPTKPAAKVQPKSKPKTTKRPVPSKATASRKPSSKAGSSKVSSTKGTRKSMSKSTAKASVARTSKTSGARKSPGRNSGARKSPGRNSAGRNSAGRSAAPKRAPGGKSGQGRSKSRR